MVANSIELDTNHPRFDLAMEMLCTIPRKPEYVSLSAVAEDLGLPDSYDMMEMVRQLQRRHFGVRVGDRSGSDCAWITPDDADHCRTVGQKYWDEVYGSGAR